ncbi:MAG TPA: M48 family metallopeptidase [Thermoanaerobaculia bacterium]|jgi:Zn-dependent protease with chaperone function|nr:M48 family metallopeptidase [Thermoanaerobaculia bacterium]
MIGFYVLALGIAGGLLWLVWYDITEAGGHIRLILFGGVIAAMILWSIVPRPIRYDIPGPRLAPEDQPELFAVIEDVARATEQQMPADVYLARDVNAGVLQVGGVLGFGTRRVLELGLPLLQSLTISQFRAVIAHEFGHYHGGDTRLAPLVYRTRESIGRTVNTLADDDGVIHKPFLWYGNFFMRVTQAISRAQELAADRLSARVAGAKNAAAALIAVEGAAAAHQSYWDSEVMPLVVSGYRPPLALGFARFTSVATISSAVSKIVDETLRGGEKNEYDSHPPLRERVEALGELASSEVDASEEKAATLLRDLPRLEEALIASIFAGWFAEKVQPVTWEEAGTRVYLPAWRERATKHATILGELTPLALPSVARGIVDFSARLKLTEEDGEHTEAAAVVVGSALAVCLHDLGWECDAMPGKPIAFTLDGKTIEPFGVMPRLRAGELTAETWEAQCRDAGIESTTLAHVCANPSSDNTNDACTRSVPGSTNSG